MKIIHVISSLLVGGAETVLMALLRGLMALGHEQEVIYLHSGPFVHEVQALQIPCHHLQAFGGYYSPLLWWRLGRLLCDLHPDVVHTSLWAANLMGRTIGPLIGVPVVTALHALPDHEGWFRNSVDWLMPTASGGTIAASATIARAWEQTGIYARGELTAIPSGVNIVRLQQLAQQPPGVPYVKKPGVFLIGAVGRLVPVKQFDKLIEVFARLVAAEHTDQEYIELLIVGSGPEEPLLRKCIAEYQLEGRVTLITGQQAAPYYPLFDCFILPSRSEGLGLVVLEAMVFKVPVIVASPGPHEIVTHGVNGLIVDPHDTESWLTAIMTYLNDPSLRATCGLAGFATVTERFSEDVMVRGYERVLLKADVGAMKASCSI